jgi:hypothetical protein
MPFWHRVAGTFRACIEIFLQQAAFAGPSWQAEWYTAAALGYATQLMLH